MTGQTCCFCFSADDFTHLSNEKNIELFRVYRIPIKQPVFHGKYLRVFFVAHLLARMGSIDHYSSQVEKSIREMGCF